MNVVNDIREGVTSLQLTIDRYYQQLIDALLSMTISGPQPLSGPTSAQPQLKELQEKAEMLQDKLNVKNQLVMSLAEALSKHAAEDNWRPLINYFKECNTSNSALDPEMIHQLVSQIPRQDNEQIQIVVEDNTSEAESADNPSTVVLIKSKIDHGVDNDNSDDLSWLPPAEEDVDAEMNNKQAKTKENGKKKSSQASKNDSSSKRSSNGKISADESEKEDGRSMESVDRNDSTEHVENIPQLLAGKPVEIDDLPDTSSIDAGSAATNPQQVSTCSSASEVMDGSDDIKDDGKRLTVDSDARRQQNDYVIKRIDKLHDILDSLNGSGELLSAIGVMVNQMHESSSQLVNTFTSLHNHANFHTGKPGMESEFGKLVAELKQNVMNDMEKGSRLLSAVKTSQAVPDRRKSSFFDFGKRLQQLQSTITSRDKSHPAHTQLVIDQLLKHMAASEQQMQMFREELEEFVTIINSMLASEDIPGSIP